MLCGCAVIPTLVYVDGTEVGFPKGSKLPLAFNPTLYLAHGGVTPSPSWCCAGMMPLLSKSRTRGGWRGSRAMSFSTAAAHRHTSGMCWRAVCAAPTGARHTVDVAWLSAVWCGFAPLCM